MNNSVYNKSILKNGVRVVTERNPLSRAVCVGFFIDHGTRDEPEGLYGAAHFIEHLVFKGTRHMTGFEIAKSLEAVGGDLNAYTSREYTCFHGTTLNEHLELSLNVLSELVSRALFAKKDFENERQVILQEEDMSKEQLDEWIYDLLFEGSYRGHPLARPILGDRASLKAMSRTRLGNYYRRIYGGHRLVVSVAGSIDHDHVVRLLEQRLDFAETKGEIHPARLAPESRAFRKMVAKSAEQAHLLLAWPSSSYTDSLRFESYIVNAVLGGGMTSRLYQSIREELGLAYSVYSSLQSFTDTGLLSIYAATSKSKAPKVIRILKSETERLQSEGLKAPEIDFYKRQIVGQILLGSDDMENRMNSLGVNEMIFSRYRPVELVIDEILRITPQSVRSYLDRYFEMDQIKALVLGDIQSKSIEKELTRL